MTTEQIITQITILILLTLAFFTPAVILYFYYTAKKLRSELKQKDLVIKCLKLPRK